jgi:hypothetical protein
MVDDIKIIPSSLRSKVESSIKRAKSVRESVTLEYKKLEKEAEGLQKALDALNVGKDVLSDRYENFFYDKKEKKEHERNIQNFENRIKSNQQRLQQKQASMQNMASAREDRAGSMLSESVAGIINPEANQTEINKIAQHHQIIALSSKMAKNTRQAEVEKRMKARAEEMAASSDEIESFAASGDKGGILAKTKQHDELLNKQALDQAILKQKRRSGTDIRGMFEGGMDTVGAIQKETKQSIIKDIINKGETGSLQEEQAKLKEFMNEFIDAFQKFSRAAEEGAENTEDLGESMKLLEQRYKDQKEIVNQVSKGGDDGSIASEMWMRTAGLGLKTIGTAGMVGGQLTRGLGVQIPLERKMLGTGFANMQNNQAEDLMNIGMDAGALRRVRTNVYKRGAKIGARAGSFENAAQMSELIGGSAFAVNEAARGAAVEAEGRGVIGKGINFVKGIATGGAATAASAVAGGFNAAAPRVGGLVLQGARAKAGIPQGQAMLAAQGADIEYGNAINRIQDISDNQFMGSARTLGIASRGMGSMRSGALNTLFNGSNQMQLARLGLGVQDQASLLQGGVGALGGEFNTSDIFSAGRIQRSGITSGSQYMQNLGQLSSVGGGSKELEDIMTMAVAAGMDNSKNVGEMVDATKNMSQSAGAFGADITSGAANTIGAQKSLNRLGFSGIKGKDQLDKIIDISQKQSLTQGMGGLFNPGMMDKIMKAGKSGMSISDLETQNPELFGEATAATKNVSGGSFSGLYSRLFGGKAAKGSIAARGAGADVEDVLAVPNISDAKKFSNSEFNNNISKLSEVLSKTIEGMNLEQMEEVVKNSAESLSQPLEGFKEQTITFQNTISDLDKTLNSFMDKIKDLINGESDAKKNNPDRTPLKESWKALSRMRTNKEG